MKIHKKKSYCVAKVTEKDDENNLVVDYLKQNYDQLHVFKDYENKNEIGCTLELSEIVMRLPKPLIGRRGGTYFFDHKINLNI